MIRLLTDYFNYHHEARTHLSLDPNAPQLRKIALGVSEAVMPFILFVPGVPIAWAIVLFSLACFG